jgi:DNA invertase Pin-like site-specific DNA recombinase
MNKHAKITALYSRLSDGDEDRDGGESNSIKNQRAFLEHYAGQNQLNNIKHYVDDDESGCFFDRPAYSAMIEDVRAGKISIIIQSK